MKTFRPILRGASIALLIALFGLLAGVARADSDITTANSSEDTETTSGDSNAVNNGTAFVGHQSGEGADVDASDIESDSANNVQEGDNDLEADQTATSESGAAVGGQVIGGVSSGDLTVNATNSSEDVDVTTGDADSTNSFAAFVGLITGDDAAIASDILSGAASNLQEGDNDADVAQESTATTGDGVAGQILGATTAGTASITLANTSDDTDADTGDSSQDSSSALFTGLVASDVIEAF
jgi:hypothetical protein